MTYLTDKIEQAVLINAHGCSDLNCITCQFITRTCRDSIPETDPKIKKAVLQYLRLKKLEKIENDSRILKKIKK